MQPTKRSEPERDGVHSLSRSDLYGEVTMGILSRVMGGAESAPKYQCSACREVFEADTEANSVLTCPVCGDRNVNPL